MAEKRGEPPGDPGVGRPETTPEPDSPGEREHAPTIKELLDTIRHWTDTTVVLLFVRDPERDQLRPSTMTGSLPIPLDEIELHPDEETFRQILDRTEPTTHKGREAVARISKTLLDHGLESVTTLPLRRNNRHTGLLLTAAPVGHGDRPEIVPFLKEFAHLLASMTDPDTRGLMIHHQATLRALTERVKELGLLTSLTTALQRHEGSSEQETYQRVTEMIAKAMQYPGHAVAGIDIGDHTTRSHPDRKVDKQIATTFKAKDGRSVILWVGYDALLQREGDPFLPEEQTLLESAGELLRLHLDHTAAERAALERAQLLDQAERMAKLGSWQIDIGSGAFTASRGLARIYHLAEGEDQNEVLCYTSRIHPLDQPWMNAMMSRAIQEEIPWRAEFRVKTESDEHRWFYVQGEPVHAADGTYIAYKGITLDVTERKRAEEAAGELKRLEDLSHFRSTFLNTAAHELNTPLTPIGLQLDLLRTGMRGALSPDQQRAIETIERNFNRLSLLVQDMLDAARLQSSRLKLMLETTDANSLLHEAIDTFTEKAEEQSVQLVYPPGDPVDITVDPRRLLQVLMNLISNALKFTPENGTIKITTIRQGATLQIDVTDSGRGLEKEQIERLFQPFTQVHKDTNVVRGTGLGLYISKGIIEAHDGRIWIESPGPGQGTTVHLSLPIKGPATGEA
jgi:signal transduction histidine kinase